MLRKREKSGAQGPPYFLIKRFENAGANENLSCGLTSILGLAPGLAQRIVVFVFPKHQNLLFWDLSLFLKFRLNSPNLVDF